jgi:hypothetical protein
MRHYMVDSLSSVLDLFSRDLWMQSDEEKH